MILVIFFVLDADGSPLFFWSNLSLIWAVNRSALS